MWETCPSRPHKRCWPSSSAAQAKCKSSRVSICSTYWLLTLARSVDATIIKHGRRSLGYGFVAFETSAEAEKARNELNKKSFDGREINVEVAKPKTSEEVKAERRAAKQQKRKEKQAVAAAATATAAADPAAEATANGAKADEATGSDDAKRTRKSEVNDMNIDASVSLFFRTRWSWLMRIC